jgi:hypothetical protein
MHPSMLLGVFGVICVVLRTRINAFHSIQVRWMLYQVTCFSCCNTPRNIHNKFARTTGGQSGFSRFFVHLLHQDSHLYRIAPDNLVSLNLICAVRRFVHVNMGMSLFHCASICPVVCSV